MAEQFDITITGGFRGAKSRIPKKKKSSDSSWYYLGVAGQIGYVVALPIAGGAIIGSFLRHTAIGLFIGLVLSFIGFIRIVQKIIQK